MGGGVRAPPAEARRARRMAQTVFAETIATAPIGSLGDL